MGGTFNYGTQIWQIYIPSSSPTVIYGYQNYGNQLSSSTDLPTLPQPIVFVDNANTGINLGPFYWVRSRAYPPNGTMPGTTFGTFQSTSGAIITIPANVNYYMPITITNNQSSATPAPFQQMIQINLNNYSQLVFNGNLANFEFFTSSGTIIPSWIESNNNGTLRIWVYLANGIGASSSTTIYLGADATYTYPITYPTAFTTENNIIFLPQQNFIGTTTNLTTLTLNIPIGVGINGSIIVEGY
jgi:phage-related tail fiber protein